MIYKTEELIKNHKNHHQIKKSLSNGKYYKVCHGLYSDVNPLLNELECIFANYPNAILTMESAFAFYDLTDYVPDKYHIATNQNAHKILNNKVSQLYMTNEILNIGKQVIQTQYGFINIYDKERMLIELFRLKKKLDYSIFREVVASYRKLAAESKLDNHKIINYCLLFKNGANIRKEIQEVIL